MNKYIAIKVRGLDVWFWFEKTKVIRKEGMFVGTEGWGKGGACTNIKINDCFIDGELQSESLQYV